MSDQVLYAGVFRDGTGWGRAALDFILAMDSVGIDVVPRAIKLNDSQPKLPQRILELEQKECRNPYAVIQHVLPHQLDYNGRIPKNIALYETETSNFKSSGWPRAINTMDEAWVVNHQSKQASADSGVEIPIRIVPHCVDTAKFERSYKPLKMKEELGDNFLFYTIGEFNIRKNLTALIKAFHLEFDPDEPVDLIIKTTPVGIKGPEALDIHLNKVKSHMKLYRNIESYKKEIVICNYWEEEDMMRLHSTCDCFVLPSYGEACALPALDAMGMGKTPIVTNCSGFPDYINDKVGWLVDAAEEPVFGMTNTWGDLYTSRENWWQASITHLRRCMREAYENQQTRKEKAINGARRAYEFGYEKVGNLIKQYIYMISLLSGALPHPPKEG